MASIQATRLRKGMLIKRGNDLFRILDLHHLTPGNKRAHIQARMRNISITGVLLASDSSKACSRTATAGIAMVSVGFRTAE